MKKTKRRFIALALVLSIFASSATAIYAASVSFSNVQIPKYQAMYYLDYKAKDTASDYGTVNLTKLTAKGVTFSVRALGDDFGSTKTLYATGSANVPYLAYYAKGTSMQARFKNTKWSHENTYISGFFNYR